uniref:Uncharacterized protein n=1 Tax=Fagus sylvatica TaxID=28930 RepID=A0A2N9ILU7_FAGSY
MSRAEFMSNHFLDNVNCSDETFIPVLRNVSFGHFEIWIKDFSEMTFWELDSVVVKVELESEVVKVGHYMISQNFVPILKSIFNKHGDICAKSTLKRETKTRFLNMFCGVVYSMCNTMAKDINRNLLLNWWKNFKLVEHAGFNIQFAFDHLYKVTQSLISVVRACDTDRTIYDYRRKMNNQTTELEKLKVQLTDHINSKTGKSIPEKQSLIEDFELFSKMHMVGTGLL